MHCYRRHSPVQNIFKVQYIWFTTSPVFAQDIGYISLRDMHCRQESHRASQRVEPVHYGISSVIVS